MKCWRLKCWFGLKAKYPHFVPPFGNWLSQGICNCKNIIIKKFFNQNLSGTLKSLGVASLHTLCLNKIHNNLHYILFSCSTFSSASFDCQVVSTSYAKDLGVLFKKIIHIWQNFNLLLFGNTHKFRSLPLYYFQQEIWAHRYFINALILWQR